MNSQLYSKAKYFQELDFLRGLAAITVFMSHFFGAYDMKQFPLSFISDGHAAVVLFFVLSGFVLMYQSLDIKFHGFIFVMRRFFRIYPAFIFSIFLALLLKENLFIQENVENYSEWFRNIWQDKHIDIVLIFKTLFLIGPHFDTNPINGVIWTLIIEMRVSIIFPIFIYLFKVTSDVKVLIGFFIFLLLLPFIFQDILLLQCIPLFYLGALYAKYFIDVNQFFMKYKAMYLVVGLYFFEQFSTYFGIERNYFKDLIIAIGSLAIMIVFLNIQYIKKVSVLIVPTLIGKTSYSFYLLHLPILLVMVSLFPQFHSMVLFLLVFVITMVLSFVVFKIIELPFITFGKQCADYLLKFQIKETKTL